MQKSPMNWMKIANTFVDHGYARNRRIGTLLNRSVDLFDQAVHGRRSEVIRLIVNTAVAAVGSVSILSAHRFSSSFT